MPTDADRERIRILLQIEGAAVFVLGAYLWVGLDLSWLAFIGLFIVPDLFMIGYLGGARWGARLYNAVHTYVGPVLLGLYVTGSGTSHELVWGVLYVWFAHIGLDRLIMAGLKYPTAFKHTHLSPARAFEAQPSTS